jgi:hypothetical protein
MATEKEYRELLDRVAALRGQVADRLSNRLSSDPRLGEAMLLGAEDVRDLFGAANAWDTIDEVLIRYFNDRLVTSPRQRMAVTGRAVLRWLAAPHILETTRSEFEALLLEIAEPAEEWITSAQSLRLAERSSSKRVLPFDRHRPAGVAVPLTSQARGERSGPARRNGHRRRALALAEPR